MFQRIWHWGKEVVRSGKRLLRQSLHSLAGNLPAGKWRGMCRLGQVRVVCPDGQILRLATWGAAGKDRLALKLHRRGWLAWEPETLPVFLALLPQVRGFVDIGANTGMFALLAARNDPARRVVAFEPTAAIHAMLQANATANQLANLTAECLALSDQCGEVTFFVTRTGGGIPLDSSLVPGFRDNVEPVRVQCTTLDDYLASQAFGPVDLLKVDVESAEAAVLRGAQKTLQHHRPAIICEILRSADTAGVEAILQPLGYRYHYLASGGPVVTKHIAGDVHEVERNFLFLPEERSLPTLTFGGARLQAG